MLSQRDITIEIGLALNIKIKITNQVYQNLGFRTTLMSTF